MTDLNVIDAVTYYKILASSVGRNIRFIKREVAGSNLNISILSLSFFFFFLIIVILDYCKVDYKVFIYVSNGVMPLVMVML